MSLKSTTKTIRKYRNLRSRLIERGFSLRSFALLHGYSVPTTYMAANGQRAGVVSAKIRKHLEELINE